MKGERIPMSDAEVWLFEHFLMKEDADQYFRALAEGIEWKHEKIRIFGKEMLQPRLTAWYGDEGKVYTYAGLTLRPKYWNGELILLKEKVDRFCETTFNSVLLNYYRDGRDSVGWHSDAEPELGPQPLIASVSLGGARTFQFRHKQNKHLKIKLVLHHGSLLLMKGATQHHWQHQIPKTQKPVPPRINLTFRTII